MQQPTRSGPATKTPSSSAAGTFLRFCSWFWGLNLILGGALNIPNHVMPAIALTILGILLLPVTRGILGRALNMYLGPKVAALVVVVAFVAMGFLGSDILRDYDLKEQRLARIAAERDRQDSLFISAHPFVDRDSLRAWREASRDSTNNPSLRIEAFLQRQRDWRKQWIADSIAGARKAFADSVMAAKQHRRDSIEDARKARLAAAEERRLQRRYEAEQSETYNGHEIYTGPRGGRYYINSHGNKQYIH